MPSILVRPTFILPRYHNTNSSILETYLNINDEGIEEDPFQEDITFPELNDIILDVEYKNKFFNELIKNLEKKFHLLITFNYKTSDYDYSGYTNIEKTNNPDDELDIWFRITRDDFDENHMKWYVIDDFNRYYSIYDETAPNEKIYGMGLDSSVRIESIPGSYRE